VAVTQAAEYSAQLLPAVDRVEERLKEKPQQMVADGSYTARDNIEKMSKREVDFLGSMKWERVPSGVSTPNRLPPSAFVYDHKRDGYVCPEAFGLQVPTHERGGLGAIPLYRRDTRLPKLGAQAAVLPGNSEAWPFGHALGRKWDSPCFPAKNGRGQCPGALPPS
jgi:hypothetical protein